MFVHVSCSSYSPSLAVEVNEAMADGDSARFGRSHWSGGHWSARLDCGLDFQIELVEELQIDSDLLLVAKSNNRILTRLPTQMEEKSDLSILSRYVMVDIMISWIFSPLVTHIFSAALYRDRKSRKCIEIIDLFRLRTKFPSALTRLT